MINNLSKNLQTNIFGGTIVPWQLTPQAKPLHFAGKESWLAIAVSLGCIDYVCNGTYAGLICAQGVGACNSKQDVLLKDCDCELCKGTVSWN